MVSPPQQARRRKAVEQHQDSPGVSGRPALAPVSPKLKSGRWLLAIVAIAPIVLFVHLLWSSPSISFGAISPLFTGRLTSPENGVNSDSQVPFVVEDLQGRGKGLVATRNIEKGELLIREKPLFRVPTTIATSPIALLHSLLNQITPTERAIFYNLSFVNIPPHLVVGTPEYEEYLPLAIFQTNAVSSGEDTAGIFPRMARLNHGCSFAFNAVYSWRDDEGMLVVYALKKIKAGEEILTTYTDTKRARAERRQNLRERYAFGCQCACCSLPVAQSTASDARLSFMSELYHALALWSSGQINSRQAVDIARKIWLIGEEEGYVSERGRLAGDVVHVAAAVEDEEAVRQWAQLGARWAGYELGNSSELVRELQRYAIQPQAHPMWGTMGRREEVGGPDAIAE